MSEESEVFEKELNNIKFNILSSIFYHMRRKSFIEKIYKLGIVLSIVSGTAVISSLLSSHHILAFILSTMTIILSTMSLVFGLSDAVRTHDELYKEWCFLGGEIENFDLKNYNNFKVIKKKIMRINSKSPPQLNTLHVYCENEARRSLNFNDFYPLNFWEILFMHFLDFPCIQKKLIKQAIEHNTKNDMS